MIKRFALALALVSGPQLVTAAEGDAATITWKTSGARVDGSPFDWRTDVQEFRLYCSGEQVLTIPPRTGGTYTASRKDMLGENYGVHDCAMTVLDTNGQESAYSNVVQIDHAAPAPAVPAAPKPPQQLIYVAP